MKLKTIKKDRLIFIFLVAGFSTLLISFESSGSGHFSSPDQPSTLSMIDSSSFTENTAEGWGTFTKYIEHAGDSVQFDVIFSRSIAAETDWSLFSLAGTLAASFSPMAERTVEYAEPTRNWLINIKPNGQCFFKLTGGPKPDGNPAVIPVQIRYKK